MIITADQDVAGATAAADCVVKTHQRIIEFLRAGLTLAEIDAEIGRILNSLDSISAFLGYRVRGHPPFPSHACLSVNECIVGLFF